MRRITRLFPVVLTLAACVFSTPALGQIESLPPTDKTVYSDADKQQINAYVTPRLGSIGNGETSARERARRELLVPLRRPGVSVAFRRAFRESSISTLTSLAGSTDDAVAINALLVLGEIADDSSRQVVQQYTADDRVAVRYAAIAAMTATFRSIDVASPAIDPGRVGEMVRHLAERLRDEPDPSVADAIARSLLVASNTRREGFAGAAARATTVLGAGVGGRLRAADDNDRQVALMTAVRVAESYSNAMAAAGQVTPEAARAGAGFAGEVLAHLASRARAASGSMPATEGWEADLVTFCERIMVFSASKLGGSVAAPGLVALVESGDSGAFYDRVSKLVLGLSGRPWNLPAEDMKRIRDALDGK